MSNKCTKCYIQLYTDVQSKLAFITAVKYNQPSFRKLCQQFPKIFLHICSSQHNKTMMHYIKKVDKAV